MYARYFQNLIFGRFTRGAPRDPADPLTELPPESEPAPAPTSAAMASALTATPDVSLGTPR